MCHIFPAIVSSLRLRHAGMLLAASSKRARLAHGVSQTLYNSILDVGKTTYSSWHRGRLWTYRRQQYLPQSGVQVYSAASKISKEIKEPESQSTQPGRGKHKHPKANMDSHGVPDACPDTFSNFLSVYFVSPLADVANTPLCADDPPVTEEQAQQAFRIYSNESGEFPNFQI